MILSVYTVLKVSGIITQGLYGSTDPKVIVVAVK